MSPMTHALISYFQRLPAESPAVRRRTLDATRERVRAGREQPAALVPFALGDVDDGIVVAATQAYVAAALARATRAAAVAESLDEVAEWVRRGLAINRGAVFGALLSLEDERVNERLVALRLTLSAAEVETVCRVLPSEPGSRARAFLRLWHELVGAGSLHHERLALGRLLDVGRDARAA